MQYRTLGRTDLQVSVIALGCEGFTGKTMAQVREDMDFAIGKGVNFIDMYTSNPDVRRNIGAALKGRREAFIIQGHLCTVWENGQYLRTRDMSKVMPAFNDLLEQMQTDYIDIGMIHYVDAMDDYDTVFNGPIIEFTQRLKAEGRIRHIGMSSHNPTVALKAVESGIIDVLMFSINPAYDLQPANEDVNVFWDENAWQQTLTNIDPDRERLYSLCEQRGVGIDVMKAYGGGDLLSEERSPFGKALTAVQCIDYALSRPGVASVMAGCRTIGELQQALDWLTASPEERDYTKVMQGVERFSWRGHCMYCGHCAPCSAGIDIASVNKFYNLCEAQGEVPETVREHYRALKHHAEECIECGLCEERCPFGVEIIEGMHKATEKFGY